MTPPQNGQRLKASDFPQEVLTLFDRYVHGMIDRRGFMDGAAKFTVGGVTAVTMFESLRPHYEWARQVLPDDARIRTDYVTYDSPQGYGTVKGLMAWPEAGTAPFPAVLVIHENRGLNPYVEDVVRRFAAAGFLALGPDALTSLGGYPGTDEEGRDMQRSLDGTKVLEDFVAGANFLMKHADSTGKVGAVGFCFGGGVVNRLAVRLPDLAAGAPFYGSQPAAEDVAHVNAPLLIHYAGLDTRINGGWEAYEAALEVNGKTYTMHMYEGTNHGFHNDTTPRYDEVAAKLAQDRTVAFFKRYLG
jgi:carboxymethylenebutenolidase